MLWPELVEELLGVRRWQIKVTSFLFIRVQVLMSDLHCCYFRFQLVLFSFIPLEESLDFLLIADTQKPSRNLWRGGDKRHVAERCFTISREMRREQGGRNDMANPALEGVSVFLVPMRSCITRSLRRAKLGAGWTNTHTHAEHIVALEFVSSHLDIGVYRPRDSRPGRVQQPLINMLEGNKCRNVKGRRPKYMTNLTRD